MGMNQMIVLQAGRDAHEAQDAPREAQPCPMNAAPTTLFEVIDRAVSAVLTQFDRWCDLDERAGEDEAHFEAYVRWRVAIIDDAAAQARTLMIADGLTTEGSPWLAAHARYARAWAGPIDRRRPGHPPRPVSASRRIDL